LFIGDHEFLEDLTGEAPPLVDDFPMRILAGTVSEPGKSGLFASLTDIDSARKRFGESPLVAELWPPPLVERTLPYFDYQRIVNNLIDVVGHPLEKDLQDLHTVLTESTLEGPVLWHLGSTSALQEIVATLDPQETALPLWQYQIAAGLISKRRFEEALDALRNAEGDPEHALPARAFRVYLLGLLHRTEEAQRLANETYATWGGGQPLTAWWGFLEETFGIRPEGRA
jgi:hypothetical protein